MHPPRPPTDTPADAALPSVAGEPHARAGLGGATSPGPDALAAKINAALPDIPPERAFTLEDLVRRAVCAAGHGRPEALRWVHVRDAFAVGSSAAKALCEACGCDPDEYVGLNDDKEPADEDGQRVSHVGLHSRGRVEELESAVEREIAELCQQAKLPGQRSIIAQMEVARDGLHEAGRRLARAERELAKEGR